jgi:hypothetical protein
MEKYSGNQGVACLPFYGAGRRASRGECADAGGEHTIRDLREIEGDRCGLDPRLVAISAILAR